MSRLPFTFYGDLLGVGSAYRLGASTAYDKLNVFYNETFHTLNSFCDISGNEVSMFSDSLFIQGDDAFGALDDFGMLYSNLLRKGLLLRGAMVSGRLKYDIRVTKQNFEKKLPVDDTLARATGLEKAELGARLLIEPTLAEALLASVPEWKSHEGYIRSIQARGIDCQRRICPTPSSFSYEYLYYWTEGIEDVEFTHRVQELKDILPMIEARVREHYQSTIDLVRRCEHRREMTNNRLK